LDIPDNEHLAYEPLKEVRKMQLLSACPTWNGSFMELLMLHTVISASDANEKIMKAMDGIKDFVSSLRFTSSLQTKIS
jgi:hypothetical protein